MRSSLKSNSFLILAAATLMAAGSVAQGLPWQTSLDAALERAAANNQPLFVAVVMPGERGSDAVIDHYRDSGLRRLTRNCVCFRVDLGQGMRPTVDGSEVLKRYLGAAPRDPVVVPHHLMVHPDGKTVLSSAAYQLTAGQLEWLIADGITQVDPEFSWELGERARPPEGLSYGEVETTETQPESPPTAAEVKEAITKLKRGGAGWGGSFESYGVLLRSSEPAAVKYVEGQLRGGAGFMTSMALRTIGEISPVEYSGVLTSFLSDRKESNRQDAARGLTKMAYDKSNKAIKKQLKSEKEPEVKAWLLRAAAATGPSDKKVITAIERAITKDPETDVRVHAVVAAGVLEDEDAAHRLMEKALEDKDPLVRSAAAYAMANRRDAGLLPVLKAAVEVEEDGEALHWQELAIEVIANKRDLRDFKNFRSEVLGEQSAAEALRRAREGGRRGGAGRGEGDPGGR